MSGEELPVTSAHLRELFAKQLQASSGIRSATILGGKLAGAETRYDEVDCEIGGHLSRQLQTR